MVKKQGIGRALLKKSKDHGCFSNRHTSTTTEDNSRLPLRSITEETSLSEFFSIAKLANSDFTAQKKSFRFISKDEISGVPSLASRAQCASVQNMYVNLLKIPRRPPWNRGMSSEELNKLENDEFLKWRRSLATLEATEGIVLTPFEKNIEFWRQLWRVVERSDVIVQIVDARQPLLYYCADLEQYAHEVDPNKVCLVLVNKSDLLTQKQRVSWHNYFKSQSIHAKFWSATSALDVATNNAAAHLTEEVGSTSSGSPVGSDSEETDSSSTTIAAEESVQRSHPDKLNEAVSGDPYSDDIGRAEDTVHKSSQEDYNSTFDSQDARLFGAAELLDLFIQIYPSDRSRIHESQLTVGFVGYPNVGKSSTLNALVGSKKTAVSATPGRTKHFQTLFVRSDLVLCDCPGLVMPSFVHSKADLVLAGILSIDEMRDCLAPIGLICEQIPRSVLEFKYGIDLAKPKLDTISSTDREDPPTPYELLTAHALSRSFMTAKGNPHYDRSARIILKDYVQGRLLYCHPPPDVDPQTFQCLGRENDVLPPSLSHSGLSKPHGSQSRKRIESGSSCFNLITQFDQLAFQADDHLSRSHIRSRKTLLPHRPKDCSEVLDGDDNASIGSSDSWTTVNSSVGGSSLLFGTDCTSWAAPCFADQKRPWRLLSHSKRADPIDSTKPGRSRKRREKLRRVYRHLDQHTP